MGTLNDAGITAATEEVCQFLEKAKITKEDRVRFRLLLEDVLDSYRKQFGEDTPFLLIKYKRLGEYRVIIRVKGECLNPFSEYEEDSLLTSMTKTLMGEGGVSYEHKYHLGVNILVIDALRIKREIKIPGGNITIAILLAILCGLLLKTLSPGVQSLLIDDICTPIRNVIMNIIVGVTGPMVFFSMLTGVCAVNDIETLSDLGKKVLLRFLIFLLIAAFIAVIFSVLFFMTV